MTVPIPRGDLSNYLGSMRLTSLISISFDVYGAQRFTSELENAVDAFSQFVSYSSATISRLSLIGDAFFSFLL